MARPPVSVCTTHLNDWPGVSHFLDSLLPQLGRDDEVVIVDAGSTGESRSYLEHISTRDPRVRLHTSPSCSRGAGRDEAWRRAKNKVILHADADRTWKVDGWNQIEALLTHISKGPVKIVTPLGQIGLGGFLLRREHLDAVGGYDTTLQYFEDTDLERRLRKKFHVQDLRAEPYSHDDKSKMRRVSTNVRYYREMYRDAARIGNEFGWMVKQGGNLTRPWRYPLLLVAWRAYKRGQRMDAARSVLEG